MSVRRLAVLIDYQNIHLTGRDKFAPVGLPPEDCLIHPLKFAEQLLATRAAKQDNQAEKTAELTKVFVYRGQPSNRHQKTLYAVSQAHRAEWTRDPRVEVWYRTLRYPYQWPQVPAREKGIDVKVAIDFVKFAGSAQFDVAILASHDTDMEPALEAAAILGRAKVETAGWEGARRLLVPGRRFWHTALDCVAFVCSRDRKKYL